MKNYIDITPDQIQDLKAKHGEIAEVEIKGDAGQCARFIIKTPTRTVLDLVGQHGVKNDVFASNKVIISNCVLGGDMDMMEADGGVYAALLTEINRLIKTKEVKVKKL